MILKKNYLFILFSLVFMIVTTDYLSLNDIIYKANQTDVISYSEIAKKAPSLFYESKIIIQHVAQRFLIPYIVGCIAFFLKLDFFIIFKVFTFCFLLLYIYLICFAAKKLKLNLHASILFFCLLFFNPYIVRHHLFQPVQAHDILFFCFTIIFALSIIFQNDKLIITSSTVVYFLRQTSIALFIGSLINFIYKKKYKKSLVLIIVFLSFYFIVTSFGYKISNDKFPFGVIYGIFKFNYTLEQFIRFIFLPLVSFLPSLMVLFLAKKNKNKKIFIFVNLIFVCIMMAGQPYLGGPLHSTRNVVRIATLCYPIFIIAIFYYFNFEKFYKKKLIYYLFIIGTFIWSLHPTFSKVKIFGYLRF